MYFMFIRTQRRARGMQRMEKSRKHQRQVCVVHAEEAPNFHHCVAVALTHDLKSSQSSHHEFSPAVAGWARGNHACIRYRGCMRVPGRGTDVQKNTSLSADVRCCLLGVQCWYSCTHTPRTASAHIFTTAWTLMHLMMHDYRFRGYFG